MSSIRRNLYCSGVSCLSLDYNTNKNKVRRGTNHNWTTLLAECIPFPPGNPRDDSLL